jgi:hypothetical protein
MKTTKMWDGTITAFVEAARQSKEMAAALLAVLEAIRDYNWWRRPERIRTGIAPRHGRTRKKQRLTRLQRRQKRQR